MLRDCEDCKFYMTASADAVGYFTTVISDKMIEIYDHPFEEDDNVNTDRVWPDDVLVARLSSYVDVDVSKYPTVIAIYLGNGSLGVETDKLFSKLTKLQGRHKYVLIASSIIFYSSDSPVCLDEIVDTKNGTISINSEDVGSRIEKQQFESKDEDGAPN